MRRRLSEIRVPRGAVAVLAALLLAPVAFTAFGHSPNMSGGYWTHHHTTTYNVCNDIDGTALRDAANDAKGSWRENSSGETTGLTFPHHTACSPNENDPDAHLEFVDHAYGTTGWRLSTVHQGGSPVVGHDATTSRLRFNTDQIGSNMTNYHKQALACRGIGESIGVAPIDSTGWAAEGLNNDCMSFQSPSQKSKKDYPNTYTFAAQPGTHSVDLLRLKYNGEGTDFGHMPSMELSGSLVNAASELTSLTAGTYDLQVDADPGEGASAPGITELDLVVDGVVVSSHSQPCQSGGCSLSHSFTVVASELSNGEHEVIVRARDALGLTAEEVLDVSVDVQVPCDGQEPEEAFPELFELGHHSLTIDDDSPEALLFAEAATVSVKPTSTIGGLGWSVGETPHGVAFVWTNGSPGTITADIEAGLGLVLEDQGLEVVARDEFGTQVAQFSAINGANDPLALDTAGNTISASLSAQDVSGTLLARPTSPPTPLMCSARIAGEPEEEGATPLAAATGLTFCHFNDVPPDRYEGGDGHLKVRARTAYGCLHNVGILFKTIQVTLSRQTESGWVRQDREGSLTYGWRPVLVTVRERCAGTEERRWKSVTAASAVRRTNPYVGSGFGDKRRTLNCQ